MPADWKILLRVLCLHERENNRIAIMVTVCTRSGARRVKTRVSSSRWLHILEKRGKITQSQMNLSIGIFLSAVSGITSPANFSAVWYVHKHPLVCAVFISISLLTLFGILLSMGCLCLLLLYRNEVICPLPHNSCWHSLHPRLSPELSVACWGELYITILLHRHLVAEQIQRLCKGV